MDKGVNLTAGKKYIADGFTITKPVVCAVLAVICVLYIWHQICGNSAGNAGERQFHHTASKRRGIF